MPISAPAERQKPPAGELYLDHVAHFVPDLAAASRAFEALGFRLTPESGQTTRAADGALVPAGTRFRSAMLGEGYIELIAPAADTPRTRRMRSRMGGRAGIHLVSFGTPAARDEHQRLRQHGFQPLELVRHERTASGAGGRISAARYQVVHVPYEKMPEGRVEYIEHEAPEALWQPHWVTGLNGGCALALLFVSAGDVAGVAARWAHYSGLLPEPAGRWIRLCAGRGRVLVGNPQDWSQLLGTSAPAPSIAGYGLAVEAPEPFLDAWRALGVPARQVADGLWSAAWPVVLGGGCLFGTRPALERFFTT